MQRMKRQRMKSEKLKLLIIDEEENVINASLFFLNYGQTTQEKRFYFIHYLVILAHVP